MKGVIKELLMEFYQCNNKMKPERLIFYRDGVSEGQFEAVQRLEIPQARTRQWLTAVPSLYQEMLHSRMPASRPDCHLPQ